MVILDDGKIVKARSVKLLPESQSWSSETLENITATPWKEQAAVEFVEREGPEEPGPNRCPS
jgi:hypothetical protein